MTFEKLKISVAISLVVFVIITVAIISFGLLHKENQTINQDNAPNNSVPDTNVIITNRTEENVSELQIVNETVITTENITKNESSTTTNNSVEPVNPPKRRTSAS
jgi:hypothetical protein